MELRRHIIVLGRFPQIPLSASRSQSAFIYAPIVPHSYPCWTFVILPYNCLLLVCVLHGEVFDPGKGSSVSLSPQHCVYSWHMVGVACLLN